MRCRPSSSDSGPMRQSPPSVVSSSVPAGQTEAFAVCRYHAVFTDSAEPMPAAEATHRDHAIVGQVIAELKNIPLAHLLSGRSPQTPPGWSAPRSSTTSPAPPARWPAAASAGPAPPACAPNDRDPRPDRALRASPRPAPTPRLALRARAGRAVPPRSARPPPRRRLTTARPGPTGDHQVEAPDNPAVHHARCPAPQQQRSTAERAMIDGGSRLSETQAVSGRQWRCRGVRLDRWCVGRGGEGRWDQPARTRRRSSILPTPCGGRRSNSSTPSPTTPPARS